LPTLTKDGVQLFYETTEGGGTPIVLIHGWCCDHTYFAPQFEHFAGLGHTLLSVDLRGHGMSDKPDCDYTMRLFADDVAWMCGELGIAKPVLVGHSMGGIVAFELAGRYPGLPSALAMLDAAVALPAAARARIEPFLQSLGGPDYRAALGDYVASALFLPTDDAGLEARILAAMEQTPRHVMISAFEGLRDYDPGPAAASLRAPALYISADETPRSDMARLRALVPSLREGRTVGSGHFCQLEVPDQVNAMIGRFLSVAIGDR